MNQPQESQFTKEQTMHQPCPCRELADTVREFLGISATARQHLANSRVEFLKALRAMLDARIEHLSTEPQKGTKLAVE
jgi:vacuolar-type H+-ATPase subunit E/Vma4